MLIAVVIFCTLFNINWLVHADSEETRNIQNAILNYFSNDNVQSFADKWKSYQPGIETALELALQENFGKPGLNVFVETERNELFVTDGFLTFDNVVHVLFKDIYLSRIPLLRNPRVSFPLASNVLRVEAGIPKIIMETKYHLFRNSSELAYAANKTDEANQSPFSLQQVGNTGQASIIAEECVLDGLALTTLQSDTVHVGYDNFYLYNCKFTVEISSDVGSPPIIAPYFNEDQGSQLQKLMLAPLRANLVPSLQGSVLSYVNTSACLGSLMPRVRNLQRSLFTKTYRYMSNVVKTMNKWTSEKNAASELREDLYIQWSNMVENEQQTSSVSLSNLTFSGLDSAYCTHSGVPFNYGGISLADSIRYNAIQFRGTGVIHTGAAENNFYFSGEIHDMLILTTLLVRASNGEDGYQDKNQKKLSSNSMKYDIKGWRNVEINGPNSPTIDTYALMSGMLMNRIPETIVKHLSTFFISIVGKGDNYKEEGPVDPPLNQNHEAAVQNNDEDYQGVTDDGVPEVRKSYKRQRHRRIKKQLKKQRKSQMADNEIS